MRTPFGPDALDLLRRRTLSHSVCLSDGVLDPEVQLRQDVGAPEAEHEEHLRRPTADAFDLDEMGDEIVVGHVLDGIER